MAFEVMIMISPFAFFFYSVFNPIFHWLNAFPSTRWLTHFFLPHMVLPPTLFLKAIRIAGSVLFVIGSVTFITCAMQVYLGKLFNWGIADKGLYRYIRHPQYLALGIWGVGMVILWPRFIVLVTLSIMFMLYYFLARDEEKRMLFRYGDSYCEYMLKTGKFLPVAIERHLIFPLRYIRSKSLRVALVFVLIPLIVIGSGFICRHITLSSIPLESKGNITLVSIITASGTFRESIPDASLKSIPDPSQNFILDPYPKSIPDLSPPMYKTRNGTLYRLRFYTFTLPPFKIKPVPIDGTRTEITAPAQFPASFETL
jgi:protein-S-isoprenylcysteine O-methyltransferase Ste14